MSNPTLGSRDVSATFNVKTLVSAGLLTAVAHVAMLLGKLLPSVNGFLDFDFKSVVITTGGFLFGPMAAAAIAFVSCFIELVTISTTGPIGFLMNFLATAGFCCTAAFIYHRRRTQMGAVLGLTAGVVTLVVVMLLWNYLITPIYQNIPRAVVAGMLLPVFLPFNLVKGGLNMALTLLLYKPVVSALRASQLLPPSPSSQGRRFSPGFFLFSLILLGTFVMLMLVLTGVL